MTPPSRGRPALRRVITALLAAALAVAPPAARAQIDQLPRLGDPLGEEFSPAAERRLGEQVMRQVRRDPAYLDDAELVDYLNAFAAPLMATPAAGGYVFEFFAIRDASINAFALPGGFIGVHTGLLINAETESELAAVLAHEIGHVTQRHVARMLSQQKSASMIALGALLLAVLAARSNPQAAAGTVLLGENIARQNLLSFSRDAEREADRVGFEILRQAGFDTQAIVSFFMRLQQATRIYESNAPAYLRTHPLTTERIGDMQDRQRDTRYRQRADSLDFRLLRARLRATVDDTAEGRRTARAIAEQMVRDNPKSGPTVWFALAVAAYAQRDWARADAALARAREAAGAPHPYFDRLAADIRLGAGDPRAAAEIARQGLVKFPDARALARVQGEALIAAQQPAAAVRVLRDQLITWRTDARLWQLLATAYEAQKQRADAHRATAERYVLLGAPMAAVDQLKRAQQAGDTDFYTASVIDARLRELEPEARRELEELRQQSAPPPPPPR